MNSPYVRALAGFSNRTCDGGVLVWSVPTPSNGRPAEEATVAVTLDNVPLQRFDVEAYIIDDRKRPDVSILPGCYTSDCSTWQPVPSPRNHTASLSPSLQPTPVFLSGYSLETSRAVVLPL